MLISELLNSACQLQGLEQGSLLPLLFVLSIGLRGDSGEDEQKG